MSDDDDFACCVSGVPGCAGDGLLSAGHASQQQCVACAYSSNSCDATTLLAHANSLLASGHALLDDDGALLAPAAALDAARAFTMLCHPYMDVTGGREWDCSRWMTALLSSEVGRAAAGLDAPPATVLELGAGMGDLALALVSSPGFGAALTRYTATDVEGRVSAIRARVAERGLGHVLRASTLWWGAAVETEYDLVVVCETLHWKGDLPDDEDTIVPLARTLASACVGRRTAVLLAHRVRMPAREARFFELCRANGLHVGACPDGAAALAFAPPEAEQLDGGSRGPMRLVVMRDYALADRSDL